MADGVTPNSRLRAARRALLSPSGSGRPMSRQELADACNAEIARSNTERGHRTRWAGLTEQSVGALERGEIRWPNEEYRRALCAVLHADERALGLYIDRPSDGRSPSHASSAAMPSPIVTQLWDRPTLTADADRRSGVTHDEELVEVLQRLHHRSRAADPEVIRHLSDAVNGSIANYESLDHAVVTPTLRRQRAWVETLLNECSQSRQRQPLYEVACAMSGLLGYLAVGRGSFGLARAYLDESFLLADLAGNGNLRAWCRGMQSFCAYYANDFPAALRLALDGLRHAGSGPQSIRLTANGAARAMGKMGDAPGVFRMIEKAHELMATHEPPVATPSSISFGPYTHAQVAGNAATAYLSLGRPDDLSLAQPDEVQRFIDLAGTDPATASPWSSALLSIDRATAMMQSSTPDLDHAGDLVLKALATVSDRPVISVRQRAAEFTRYADVRWNRAWHVTAIRDALSALERRHERRP